MPTLCCLSHQGDILAPLRHQVSVWVWRYELSYSTGYTFMMPFIGATR